MRAGIVAVAITLVAGVAMAQPDDGEEFKCGGETLEWKPCEDRAGACYETSYMGIGGRVWFQEDSLPASPFFYKVNDSSWRSWTSTAESARDGLCRFLVEESEKPLDLDAGDEELRKALGLPR